MKELSFTRETRSNLSTDLAYDTTIFMPIGGRATRALEVTQDAIPKHLIPMGEQTVIDLICQGLQGVGFRNFVFCVGHHQDQLRSHIDRQPWTMQQGVNYEFSPEEQPLGADGAVLQAIKKFGLQGQGIIIPGDVLLPWQNVASMVERHKAWGTDLTVGVTSYTTERTTDIGKMIVEESTDRILWCYGREDQVPKGRKGSTPLTSAAVTAISTTSYVEMCDAYLSRAGQAEVLSIRDHVLPYVDQLGGFAVHAYDVEGEILDLGTPANIAYGKTHWAQYT